MKILLYPFRHLLLAVIIACICFPAFNLTYASGIDEPLIWAFNYFADGHFEKGQHIIFPHGPLAFLLYPLPVGNNVLVAGLVAFFCSVLLSLKIFKLYDLSKRSNDLLVSILLVVVQTVMDLQLMLVGLILSYVLLFHNTNKKKDIIFAAFFCVLGLFIKSYIGILGFLILISEGVYSVYSTKKIRSLLESIASVFIFICLFWLSLYHNFSGLVTYFRGQWELMADNSEAVSLMMTNNWWLLALSLLSLICIPFLSREKYVRHYFFIFLLPLCAAWKHAMARQDDVHVLGFVYLLVFFYGILFILVQQKKILITVLSFISIGTFALNLAMNSAIFQEKIPLIRPFNIYGLLVNYDHLKTEKNLQSQKNTLAKILPDSLLKILGTKTVDVYPWNYAIIAANELNWRPRPVLHSYATYTHWLDKKNADHFQSPDAPDFLIWELNLFYDQAPSVESIDGRYLLNDGPQSILALFNNYTLVYTSSSYLLYKKNLTLEKTFTQLSEPLTSAKLNTWIDVPEASPNRVTKANIHFRKTKMGYLKSFLFKGEEFYIHYQFADSTELRHRIVPKNARDGLWLYPFTLNPDNDKKERTVKRIKLSCSDMRMVDTNFELQFEFVNIPASGTSGDVQNRLFGKADTLLKQ